MNVIFNIHGKEYTTPLRDAKRVLNDCYNGSTSIEVNNETISVDRISRDEIKKQLHGQIYV